MHQPDFWQRRSARSMPKPLERRTHIALADTLRLGSDWLWWHNANGELRTEQTGKLLKRMGVLPGLSDFTLVNADGAHHYLEIKRGPAVLTDAQVAFLQQMRERGVEVAVARGYDQAVAQLKQWGAL